MLGNKNISENFTSRVKNPPQCQLRRSLIERLERYPNTRPVSITASLISSVCPPPRIIHKLVADARCTANPPFRYHTDTQGSSSVGQWKTVAMAAHPEPCCHMIWGVMLLNQPPFLFSALLPQWCWHTVEIQNGIQSQTPRLCTSALPSRWCQDTWDRIFFRSVWSTTSPFSLSQMLIV